MSATDVDACLSKDFAYLLQEHDCDLRHVLHGSVRACLEELDALDRAHPIWAHRVVQTVNDSRLQHLVAGKLEQNPDDEAALWCEVAFDLKAGSCVSIGAWDALERLSPRWRREWPLVQALFNYYLFGPQRWLEELKAYLVRHERLEWALQSLRDSGAALAACVDWLTSEADRPPDQSDYADLARLLMEVGPREPDGRRRRTSGYS